jgi:hypothetical protein
MKHRSLELVDQRVDSGPTKVRPRPPTWLFLLVTGSALVLIVLANIPFLSTYAVHGDDFGVLYHSAKGFSPSPVEWITNGYAGYDITIPELGGTQTNWIRPVLNASVYLQSLGISDPTSVWYLALNYVGHAVVVGLVLLVALRIFRLSSMGALLAAVLFFGTTSTEGLFTSIAFRGDMLGTLFALAALLTVHSHLADAPRRWKPVAVFALLLLAVFTKEAAIVAPVVVAIYVVAWRWPTTATGGWLSAARRAITDNVAILALVLLPILIYGAARIRAGLGGNYALDDLPNEMFGIPLAALNPFRFLATAFFPIETDTLKSLAPGGSLPNGQLRIAALRGLLAVIVNVLAWAAIAYAVRRANDRGRLISLLSLGLAASALPIIIKADPRFMYFGQALLLPLLVAVLARIEMRRWRGRQLRSLAGRGAVPLLVLIGPVYLLTQVLLSQHVWVAQNQQSEAIQVGVAQQLRDPAVHRLYLVNAAYQRVALEFVAAMEGRRDVLLRVVDPLGYYQPTPNEDGVGTSFRLNGNRLAVQIRLAPGQQFVFGYVTQEALHRLQTSKEVDYGPITELGTTAWGKQYVTQEKLSFSVPHANRTDYAIVGFDPLEPGVHVYKPSAPGWHVATEVPQGW